VEEKNIVPTKTASLRNKSDSHNLVELRSGSSHKKSLAESSGWTAIWRRSAKKSIDRMKEVEELRRRSRMLNVFGLDNLMPCTNAEEASMSLPDALPNAIFARKFGLAAHGEPLPPALHFNFMPTAESIVMEIAGQSVHHGSLPLESEFRGPFTPQLGFDGGLDYKWETNQWEADKEGAIFSPTCTCGNILLPSVDSSGEDPPHCIVGKSSDVPGRSGTGSKLPPSSSQDTCQTQRCTGDTRTDRSYYHCQPTQLQASKWTVGSATHASEGSYTRNGTMVRTRNFERYSDPKDMDTSVSRPKENILLCGGGSKSSPTLDLPSAKVPQNSVSVTGHNYFDVHHRDFAIRMI
jgi:hypothetical protein